jgi:outer membrane protein insertion porin family
MLTITRLIIVLVCALSSLSVMAQTDYDNGKKYTIAELKITGLQTYNEQTVKTYTGLREGMLITIPGEQISAIINKLWDLELFSDINFYLNKVEGDQAFLELEIIERPVLSEVKKKKT